jgi:hypothetical protein
VLVLVLVLVGVMKGTQVSPHRGNACSLQAAGRCRSSPPQDTRLRLP